METLTQHAVLARFGYALSDPVRSRILLTLREGPSYPGELAELAGVSKQRLSNHLSCLRGCGLVVAAVEGRRIRYELADQKLGEALSALLHVVVVSDPMCSRVSKEEHGDGEACCR
ncbi:metalloregulator ArsR/SmtB family transcription factor [Arthrobacter sp. H20]|uniref:ArsR/SmtB family transcription factor n=1 Tax=Arthrobacter sp. H20 TaxID=1267981 RepID=UPI0020A6BA98|nr:metalloregulator ArsR/SmtB family transcription factor [Arthrobacter sp. H20]